MDLSAAEDKEVMLKQILNDLGILSSKVETARVDLDAVKTGHRVDIQRLERQQIENEKAAEVLKAEVEVYRRARPTT